MDITDKNFSENQLLEELARAYYRPPLDESIHVTPAMLAARLGCKDDAAKSYLDEWVKSGRAEWVEVRKADGKVVRAVQRI